jgi:hypothetical protein
MRTVEGMLLKLLITAIKPKTIEFMDGQTTSAE